VCGIYGIFDPSARIDEGQRAWAERARRQLQHRGPDGHQRVELADGYCLLGHLRLAIIDLESGAQPLSNEDKTIWVVCNGEIYNYLELREQLIAEGHQFRTQSDTEVLVHLYERKGDALLEDLEGMFAFAIFDERKRAILLARDRFGEKPLYWTRTTGGQGIAFASEMKALLSFPGVDQRQDVAALSQFLFLRCIPAPRTHLRGVQKLAAGEALGVDFRSGLKRRRYWKLQISANDTKRIPNREEAVEEVRRLVRQSVRLRLRSDVPVGAFLSGGIDSTAIVCAARDLLPGATFSTFCASFDDQALDEAPYARMVAQHIQSDHHEVHFSSAELLENFEALIDHFDEPFADVSMFPTFAVCREARKHCKVMLSGDGGDEWFAGYREVFSYSQWHRLRRATGTNRVAGKALQRWKDGWRGLGLLTFLSKNDWELLYPGREQSAALSCFQPDCRVEAEEGLLELKEEARYHARLPFPYSALEATATSYLPEQILVKVDRASMRSALECRSPFLDTTLMRFVTGLPPSYNIVLGKGKSLLREALPEWVPPQIRQRQKQGFTPPLARWLRSELRKPMEDALYENHRDLCAILNPEPAKALFREHQAGFDHSDRLFRWLVLCRRCANAVA
jgi:asparagine synthase (glutamine-hydrolysing)